jgi:hypothetical protein
MVSGVETDYRGGKVSYPSGSKPAAASQTTSKGPVTEKWREFDEMPQETRERKNSGQSTAEIKRSGCCYPGFKYSGLSWIVGRIQDIEVPPKEHGEQVALRGETFPP